VPYVAIALALGFVTIYFQNHGPKSDPVVLGGLITRSIGAGTALFFYLGKFILPVDLLPIYPRWTLDPPSLLQVLTVPALAGLLFGLWTQRKSWGRHALFGFGFFLINLLPVLGLVKMRYMSFSWVADHLVYLPMIGLIGLVVSGLENGYRCVPVSMRPLGSGMITVLMALLGWQSHQYAQLYVDEKTLWTYSLRHNSQDWITRNNLGFALYQDGRTSEAMELYAEALKINPDYAEAYNNLGIALMRTGAPSDAIEQFEQALKINPDFASVHFNLGNALLQTGQVSEAIEHLEQALKIDSDDAGAHYSLGNALMQTGQVSGAIEQFEQTLKINPDDAQAHNNLGVALAQTGRTSEAARQFQQALQIKPDDIEAYNNLAKAKALLKAPSPKN
jgi:Flp pilus assembly protein TadD